ncbi:copper amine oxidase N-terminal domain-containing protein [Paenibacillus sp. GCM10012307]|uniref:Copper amine oxidase N-terminal domain-containing protein n=1 Tax=Paenibacillus roseus TaxID=2798579 RepID=A0A934MK02_9BACL|nr:copper amine oxidase N-terminal domain-containing protein [Paenibacillus roseus]MBJ6360490.1 copper amine oxidase N-terminal domain-containing protein [Paenibacillus roseus]
MIKMMAAMMAATILFTGAAATKVEAASDMKFKTDLSLEVLFDARRIKFDVKPKMVDGSVLVPIRFVSEKLGGKLEVKGKDITITKGTKVLKLTMDSKKAAFNGKAVTLTQPAMVVSGRTLVPLRAISEGLAVNVQWDQTNNYVWIGKTDVPHVDDLIKETDAKPYMKYYPKDDTILTIFSSDPNFNGKKQTTIRLVKSDDFPLVMGNGRIIFRLDKSLAPDGGEYVRFSSNYRGSMNNSLFLLQSGVEMKLHGPRWDDESDKTVTLEYIPMIKRFSQEKTKMKDIEYFGFNLSGHSLYAMKNEWR